MATKNTIDDFIIGDKLDNNNYDVAQKIQYLLNEQEGLKGPNLIPWSNLRKRNLVKQHRDMKAYQF